MITERMKRLDEWTGKVESTIALAEPKPSTASPRAFVNRWPAMQAALNQRLAERETADLPVEVRNAWAASDKPDKKTGGEPWAPRLSVRTAYEADLAAAATATASLLAHEAHQVDDAV